MLQEGLARRHHRTGTKHLPGGSGARPYDAERRRAHAQSGHAGAIEQVSTSHPELQRGYTYLVRGQLPRHTKGPTAMGLHGRGVQALLAAKALAEGGICLARIGCGTGCEGGSGVPEGYEGDRGTSAGPA